MNPEHFRYSEEDGVATIRLDRPDRLNALTFDSYAELRDTFAALGARASVRRPHIPTLPRAGAVTPKVRRRRSSPWTKRGPTRRPPSTSTAAR